VQNIFQCISSDAAWSQAVAAWVTNFIALFGLVITIIVACYAAKTYSQAKRQADAAHQAFLQAKRQADAADKAWLGFEAISLSVINRPDAKDHPRTHSYRADFQITNYGRIPARILFVGVELIAPVIPGWREQPFDVKGNIIPEYTITNDNGGVNYELADKMIPAYPSSPVKAQYCQSILTYTRTPVPQRELRTLFLWLKIRYSDQGSDEREMASLFSIPYSGRIRLMSEYKTHTYLRDISSA